MTAKANDSAEQYEGPEGPEIRALLKQIGAQMATKLPAGWGFALEIFQFGGGSFVYISNATRADVVKSLEEMIRHLKGQ